MQNKVETTISSPQEGRGESVAPIPPLSPDQVHALIGGGQQSQFQLRRQADRYLLILAVLLLALAASILWHTASRGLSLLNVAIIILSAYGIFVVLRAARSLWLMRQTLRLRFNPGRMARYALRLNRLSRRRHRWLSFVLSSSYESASSNKSRKIEFFTLRIPSYAIAACLFLLIAVNSDKVSVPARSYVCITTTSDKPDAVLFDEANKILNQL